MNKEVVGFVWYKVCVCLSDPFLHLPSVDARQDATPTFHRDAVETPANFAQYSFDAASSKALND